MVPLMDEVLRLPLIKLRLPPARLMPDPPMLWELSDRLTTPPELTPALQKTLPKLCSEGVVDFEQSFFKLLAGAES